jgi:hypothetical protein
MLGPGIDDPAFGPTVGMGKVLVEFPADGSCPKPDSADLLHDREKGIAVARIDPVADSLQNAARFVV